MLTKSSYLKFLGISAAMLVMASPLGVLAADQEPITRTKSAFGGGGVYGEITIGTSAVEIKVGASRLARRVLVTMQPVDRDMYCGYDSSVTVANGTKIFKSQLVIWDADDQSQIWCITDLAGKKARISEAPIP